MYTIKLCTQFRQLCTQFYSRRIVRKFAELSDNSKFGAPGPWARRRRCFIMFCVCVYFVVVLYYVFVLFVVLLCLCLLCVCYCCVFVFVCVCSLCVFAVVVVCVSLLLLLLLLTCLCAFCACCASNAQTFIACCACSIALFWISGWWLCTLCVLLHCVVSLLLIFLLFSTVTVVYCAFYCWFNGYYLLCHQ